MKTLVMIATIVCATAWADGWEEKLDAPQSGDRVVLNDRTYVLFSEEDFKQLTDKLNVLASIAHKQWKAQHSTEDGRRAWHGSKISTTVTTNDAGKIVKVVEYSDGYKHTEEFDTKKRQPQKQAIRPAVRKALETDVPKRLRDARNGVNVTREVK